MVTFFRVPILSPTFGPTIRVGFGETIWCTLTACTNRLGVNEMLYEAPETGVGTLGAAD